MDDRVRERLIDLGELCTHNTDRCYDCLERRLKRALNVISLQSHVLECLEVEKQVMER